MTTVIKIENLSKKYIIGHQKQENYTALRDVLMHKLRGISERIRHPLSPNKEEIDVEEFWALKDVNFEIKQGDCVGIIGRNGAGKSTLLKLLSRITEPTNGKIQINGRVASLLEVGTGFHPELSGRENIYLNGAILGMSRAEIKCKFDEIVAFSEVEKFLDTPVKRYSSGMYVRLAFAVAAHLEPEILIVDEVLAVGDAQFQKKCLGKMEEVGKQGRTVLFVSHNMPMIASLCQKAIWLNNGQVKMIGRTPEVINSYYFGSDGTAAEVKFDQGKRVGDEFVTLISASIRDADGKTAPEINIDDDFEIWLQYRILRSENKVFVPNLKLYNSEGICVCVLGDIKGVSLSAGEYLAKCLIPGSFLNDGSYYLDIALSSFESTVQVHFWEQKALTFTIVDPIQGVKTRISGYSGPIPGVVRPLLDWNIGEVI